MLASAARPALAPARRPHGPAVRRHDALTVRAWARSVGYPVDESAGLPREVLDTYRRVHGC